VDDGPELECHGIRFSEETLDEMDEDRAVVRIPHAEIVRLTLRHGVASERTILLLLVAAGLIGFTLLLAFRLVQWFLYGGVAYDVHFALLFLGPAGAWLLYFAFRKRFYLLVEIGRESRKLAFERSATRRAVEDFVERLQPLARYPVRNALDQ
jgi:hypothetical protein